MARTTTFDYDALNRPTRTTDPLGHITRSDYDPLGHLTTQTDPRGSISEFFYAQGMFMAQRRDYLTDGDIKYVTVGDVDGNGTNDVVCFDSVTQSFVVNLCSIRIDFLDRLGRFQLLQYLG